MRQFILFTNRNVLIFDDDGTQDVAAQTCVSCYEIDKERAQAAIDSCDCFYISHWREWKHEVPRRAIEYMLGLRTRERDLEEGPEHAKTEIKG